MVIDDGQDFIFDLICFGFGYLTATVHKSMFPGLFLTST